MLLPSGDLAPKSTASGLPLFVYIGGHTPLLARYLRKFPDLRVIICHCGMPPAGPMQAGVAALEALPDSAEYWANLNQRPVAEAFETVLRGMGETHLSVVLEKLARKFEGGGDHCGRDGCHPELLLGSVTYSSRL